MNIPFAGPPPPYASHQVADRANRGITAAADDVIGGAFGQAGKQRRGMCEGFVSDRDSSPRACDLRFCVLTWALKHISSGQIHGMVSEGGT